MRSFVAREIEAQARCTAGRELLVITSPAPVVPADRLLARLPGGGPVVFWDAPAEERAERVAFVGFGEAARIEGSGPERMGQVVAQATRLFGAMRESTHPEAIGAPRPRLFGGLAFRPEPERQAPWAAFGDASFTLPRVQYASRADAAWLQLVVRAEELTSPEAILAELAWVEEAIARAAREEGRAVAEEARPGDARVEGLSDDAFCALVEAALAEIRARAMEKVVAVAQSRVELERALDVGAAVRRMGEAYGDCKRFAIQRGQAVFVGASPERLVLRHGRAVETDALAGTARRGADEAAIQRALMDSPKERREHRLVVEAIARVLGQRCSTIDVPDEPRIRTLRNVHHLWTPIRGALREPLHVLSLVEALHPTPAVCGTPRDTAFAWIAAHEPVGRGWYTGAVGWFDAAGDGEFAVAIRAGVLGAREAWLYAGAGIVEGSDPRSEFAETRAKQAPMLSALGLLP